MLMEFSHRLIVTVLINFFVAIYGINIQFVFDIISGHMVEGGSA